MPNPKTKEKSVKISDLYKLYFECTLHESKAIWDTSQIFLLANTFLASFIGSNIYKNTIEDINHKIMYLALPLLGLAISLLWLTSFERIKKHYYFRMYQTKSLENDFQIFSGKAENLANGGVEIINVEKFDYKLFGLLNLSSFVCLRIIIIVFMIFYLYLIIQFFPKN